MWKFLAGGHDFGFWFAFEILAAGILMGGKIAFFWRASRVLSAGMALAWTVFFYFVYTGLHALSVALFATTFILLNDYWDRCDPNYYRPREPFRSDPFLLDMKGCFSKWLGKTKTAAGAALSSVPMPQPGEKKKADNEDQSLQLMAKFLASDFARELIKSAAPRDRKDERK